MKAAIVLGQCQRGLWHRMVMHGLSLTMETECGQRLLPGALFSTNNRPDAKCMTAAFCGCTESILKEKRRLAS